MHHVLVVQAIHPDALVLFDERADITYEVLDDTSPEAVQRAITEAHAVTVRAAPVTVAALAAAPGLRVVSRHGVGYDNVPIDYCTSRGVPVTVVGDVNAISVAEQTMFLMLGAARVGTALDGATRAGDFAARDRITGVELCGRTLLIVGLGTIGRLVASRATAFGMTVIAHDPWLKGDAPAGVDVVDRLDDALSGADVVSVHVPLTEHTRYLLDARALDLLPTGSIVVNTARGGIVDEAALLERVRSGRLHGAGLDVFEGEPLPSSSPLADQPRIVLSPHSAALTEESLRAMGVATVRNVLDALDGVLDPSLVVNPSVLTGTPPTGRGNIGEQEVTRS